MGISQIEDTLFRVPRLGLASYSAHLDILLKEHNEHVDINCDPEPLHMQDADVKSVDFARLLDLIYPS